MNNIKYLIISLRPHQWTKNLLVFAALIFSANLFEFDYIKDSILIFIYFCLAAGSIYVINDIVDRNEDIIHPEKKKRPIACGNISIVFSVIASITLLIVAVIGALCINITTGAVLGTYVILTLFYTIKLKHIVIIDILLVAIGFVLRAVAGAVAIDVYISSWLLVCTFFLALFLVIGKRRQELILLNENAADHRKILAEYNIRVLDQMIAVVAAITIVSYALYTLDSKTIEKFSTENLVFTIPLVILGLFRYFYLVYKKDLGSSPERILISDKGIMATVLVWILLIGLIIY